MRKLAAEFLGTFLLFLAVGNAVFGLDRIGAVGVALAFGLVLLALAYAIGPISGCHVNPAVTLGVLLTRRVALGEAAAYWVVQILGAIAGAALITGLTWFGKGQGPGGRPGPQLVGCHGLAARSSSRSYLRSYSCSSSCWSPTARHFLNREQPAALRIPPTCRRYRRR